MDLLVYWPVGLLACINLVGSEFEISFTLRYSIFLNAGSIRVSYGREMGDFGADEQNKLNNFVPEVASYAVVDRDERVIGYMLKTGNVHLVMQPKLVYSTKFLYSTNIRTT